MALGGGLVDGCSANVLGLWHAGMTVLAVANLALLAVAWRRTQDSAARKGRYGALSRVLAIPWVFEGAYRSVFCSLYLQRYVYFDSPLNAILVDRVLAFFGELSWVAQICLVVSHIDVQSCGPSRRSTPFIQLSALLAFVVYVVAEAASFYNTATTNELWAAIEVLLDGFSFLCMLPACFVLRERVVRRVRAGLASSTNDAVLFVGVMCIACIAYPAYNTLVDAPMYMKRYHEDQANNKTYFPFLEGLADAATRRIRTRELSDWSADMPWMTAYFSFGAWSGLWLMRAPDMNDMSDPARPAANAKAQQAAAPAAAAQMLGVTHKTLLMTL